MYNYCFVVGRLVRDAEVRKTESGKSVTTITLAVNKPFKNNQTNTYDADFISAVLWEPLCESISPYLNKGDLVGVKGRIQSRTSEVNGQTVYTQEVVCEKVIFLSSNKVVED